MKRVLIVGASSFIGSNLCVSLRRKHHIVGTYFGHRPRVDRVPCIRLPLVPEAAIQETVALFRPDAVIYCAAERDEAKCRQNPLGALFLNADGAGVIAEALRRWKGRLVYFSSSKVFSGERGNYTEKDAPDPSSTYGETKRKAEDILSRFENVFIVRLGTVFGWGSQGQDSMLNRLLSSLWRNEPLALIDDEHRSFLSMEDVCGFIDACVGCGREKAGLYHLAGEKAETYFEFAVSMARVFGIKESLLKGVSGKTFERDGFRSDNRGKNLSLDGRHTSEVFSFFPKDTVSALRAIRESLRRGLQ